MGSTHRTIASLAAAVLLGSVLGVSAMAATPECFGKKATKIGTAEGETINGTAGSDVIVSKGGKDTINGKGGKDFICSGDGNDVVSGGGGDDSIAGGAGNDTLGGGNGTDLTEGNAGVDGCLSETLKSCEADVKVNAPDMTVPAMGGIPMPALYIGTVKNLGDSIARDVVVRTTNITSPSIPGLVDACTLDITQWNCAIGNLAPGQSRDITGMVFVGCLSPVQVKIERTSSSPRDPQAMNDVSIGTVQVADVGACI